MVDASLFRATLRCTLNNLTDSRWPPKSLRSRERHANRGLESWVQNQRRNRASFTVTGRLKLSSSTSSTVIRVAPGRREDLRLQHSTGPKIGGYQWFVSDGDMGEQVRRRQVPIIGSGQGVSIWVHIDDAAEATVRALDCAPGPYNIVDDSPCEQRMWLTAFARYCGAPEPPHVSEQEALQAARSRCRVLRDAPPRRL